LDTRRVRRAALLACLHGRDLLSLFDRTQNTETLGHGYADRNEFNEERKDDRRPE